MAVDLDGLIGKISSSVTVQENEAQLNFQVIAPLFFRIAHELNYLKDGHGEFKTNVSVE